ncbi:N-acetyltransferase [Lentzea sp. HUAS12]|uniref:N-acetyltransferase n=1 Tax=Lentzea sp. HUAS12 TaxID=2951806 RepID=UPI00209EDC99|nr:N-acetyltransferase [Lentzea sp. HUAS12]USX51444.1 N-acetyltransferase [Lentzea sp. HUAS12]
MTPFAPDDFEVPRGLVTESFRLEPLGPQYNERDHRAWTSSIAHVRSTPGFETWGWPPAEGMSLERNLTDLVRHADDFRRREGFTYSVLVGDEVVGCVYIYPVRDEPTLVQVHSWVCADHAELDEPLHEVVSAWLAARWSFPEVRYAPRP